jgi:monoamine oxidase
VSRTPLFNEVARALRIARFCNDRRLSTADGLACVQENRIKDAATRQSRREWLNTVARAGMAGAAASVLSPAQPLFASRQRNPSIDVGIVGAGIAGLACADTLAAAGVTATVYEAGTRVGGRCASLRNHFPGQVAERGGEFIDNLQKTMLRYARRFNLALEDVSKEPGDVFYHLGGERIPESTVVDEFRAFVDVMRLDLRHLSKEVTALAHTTADVRLDRTSLMAYLGGENAARQAAGSIAEAAITAAYIAEYGLEADQQSCLNFLLFIHADRRSKFRPFGVFSDERYHVLNGNDRIVSGLAQALPRPVQLGVMLRAVREISSGRIELTFDTAAGTVMRTHDAVVLAIPFTTLRNVRLDINLDRVAGKRGAIARLGYGTNAKMMVGFTARPWIRHGGNGTAYSDLPDLLCTWETNPGSATSGRAVMTDYLGGIRGASASVNPGEVQLEAEQYLADLNRVFPGAHTAARRVKGSVVAHLEHWPSNPLALGSYTCYMPGQFTTIAGLEGLPVRNVFFAGEHANSFYEWQGFMEGAALSGLDVAASILKTAKR